VVKLGENSECSNTSILFAFWTKAALLKVLCVKKYYDDAKTTCATKYLVSLNECTTIHTINLKTEIT
jgi:hypothetical protein